MEVLNECKANVQRTERSVDECRMTNKEHIEQTISFLELHRLNAEEQKLRRQAEYPVLLEEARLAKERASDCHQQETRCEYLARDYETAIAILRGLLNEDS